ncbi:DUF2690 domain-containing protein [Micromonospora andamanensis]|uniref:DUF2690 domain-containing protein n=1 Tax=Micromonospora andamanensis TaxID=1287068 RepID=A0ABQ4HSV4_9ACTN|nr:DUF2690 domain-containing protein [Micromonospora andamanensis]GIJ08730.1 hypothetical protein Van01_19440 [Micromonospora andamanensis]GIJ41979.1 hypothetical protein Vwe01_53040 [Micromonospora andamanensis]
MFQRRSARLAATLALCFAAGLAAPQAAVAAPAPAAAETAVAETTVKAEDLDPTKATMIPEVELMSAGCGATCDGKNPATFKIYHSGCSTCYHYCSDDAQTVASNNNGISLELRYSPRCRTAWARVGSDFYYPTVRSYYLDGRVRTSYSGFAGAFYTQMVNDANLLARAEASAGPSTWWTSKY